MIVSQAVRGSAIALLTVLVATDAATIGILIAAAFVVGLGEVLTDGASPAFIKELFRRAALVAAERSTSDALEVGDDELDTALRELVLSGGDLSKRLLGFHAR